MMELACENRKVAKAVAAGSVPPEIKALKCKPSAQIAEIICGRRILCTCAYLAEEKWPPRILAVQYR